jgi:hypothetical protein
MNDNRINTIMGYIRHILLYAYTWLKSALMNPLKNVYDIGKEMEYQNQHCPMLIY